MKTRLKYFLALGIVVVGLFSVVQASKVFAVNEILYIDAAWGSGNTQINGAASGYTTNLGDVSPSIYLDVEDEMFGTPASRIFAVTSDVAACNSYKQQSSPGFSFGCTVNTPGSHYLSAEICTETGQSGPGACYLIANVTFSIAQTTITVNQSPVVGTWSSSDGHSGNTVSTSYQVSPPSGGLSTTVSCGTPPAGYVCDHVDPGGTGSQVIFPGGSYTYTVYWKLASPLPTVTLTSNLSSLACSQTATLSWSSTDATSCYASSPAGWTASTANAGSQAGINAGTYTMTCTGPGGIKTSAPVTITSACVPMTVSVTASPSTVASGGGTTISWSSTGATSCAAWWTPSTATSGSQFVSGIFSSTDYVMTCVNGSGGSASGTAHVTVTGVPATANLGVSTNLPGGFWTINPGPLNGTGLGTGYVVTPASGGTVYTLTPGDVPGYGRTVTGPFGGGNTLTLLPGGSSGWTINYFSTGPSFDYSLSTPGPLNVTKGSPGQETIVETLVSGTSQPVTITATGMPAGVTVTSYANQGCSPTCSAVVTFNVAASTAAGAYTITVSGNGGGVVHSTSFTINVLNSGSFTVACSVSPAAAQVGQPVTWTATQSGGTGPFTYQWSGTDFMGTPTGNPYVFTYQGTGSKTATVIVTDTATSQQATCPANGVTNTLQVGIQPVLKEF